MAEFKRNRRVFDRDSTNICRIANLKPGGERATKTAQSTYWSCCDTIRTQILNWRKNCWLLRSGFCVETRCNGSVPGWNRTRNQPGNFDPLLTLVISSWDTKTMWADAPKICQLSHSTFNGIKREFMRKSNSGSRSIARGWEEMTGYLAGRKHTNCVVLRNLGNSKWDQELQ